MRVLDPQRAVELGIWGNLTDPYDYRQLTPSEFLSLFPYFLEKHSALNGWAGLGLDFSVLPDLLPSLYWGIGILVLRMVLLPPVINYILEITQPSTCSTTPDQQRVLPKTSGSRTQVSATASRLENKSFNSPNSRRQDAMTAATLKKTLLQKKKKLLKFQNQAWLAIFYITSSVYGYCILRDRPWFGFPLNRFNRMSLLVNHPQLPDQQLLTYYHYEMGFYMSEIIALMLVPQRADFFEYVAHHAVTIGLMLLSHVGYEHRIGAYILILHDMSDIMLAVSKVMKYLEVREWIVNTAFAVFIVNFVFFRLICLPLHGIASALIGPLARPCSIGVWLMISLLQVVLQGLHIFWFYLIVRMVTSLLRGKTDIDDIRSDPSEDEEEQNQPQQ